MSEREEQLNELKTILNSLVIPYPEGLTLRQLCNDFRDIEGQMIPFRDVGFSSVTALLKSMPDMIRMIGNLQDINTVVLFPVRNETTSHIIDLVQKQNKGKKKSRRPFPRFNSYSSAVHRPLSKSFNTSIHNRTNLYNQNISHFSRPIVKNSPAWRPVEAPKVPPTPINIGYNTRTVIDYTKPSTLASNMNSLGEKFLNFRITKNLNKQLNEQINEQTPNPLQTRSTADLNAVHINGFASNNVINSSVSSKVHTIPNELKDNIRLMMSSPDIAEGFMLFNFEARYRHQFKEPFEFKRYGFQTLTDCLQSLTDVLQMIPTGTKTYKLMPLKTSTSQPKSESVPKTTTVITNGHSYAIITSTSSSTSSSTTVTFVTTNSTITTNLSSTTISTTPKQFFTIPASNSSKPDAIPVSQPVMCPISSTLSVANKSMDNQSLCSYASNDSNLINNKTKQNFRTILLFNENGINALDFAAEYEKYFKVSFDSRFWGFKSSMELFHGLPKIFAIEINEKNEKILHDSRFKKFEAKPMKKGQDMNTKFLVRQIPDIMFARTLSLVQMSAPLGLPLDDFVELYERNYGCIESTIRQLRFSDVFHLFEAIKEELPIDIKNIEGQNRVFIKSKEELNDWTVRQTRAHKFIIPITLVDCIPANVVLPGEPFRPIQLPERFKPGNYEYVAVYISSAVNPHEIYIQFKGTEYHTALETLMFSLDFYETAPEEKWSVPFAFLYVGYPVVCRYPGDKNWHRARISRIHASDKRVVTVSFVDYGGTHVIDYSNLRLMKKEFLSLPIQALKVGLYGIRPILGSKASDWTASARDKLLRFSRPQYALACTLIEDRPENHWVAICDTNTTSDVFLHLVLVNDKHAVMSEDIDDHSSKDKPSNKNMNYLNASIAQTNDF